MPKFIAHALMGASIVAAIHPTAGLKNWTPLVIGAVLAVSPDFDFIFDWIFSDSSIHRGISHSLVFSLAVGIAICILSRHGEQQAGVAYSFAYLSHTLLDFFTSTTGGVKLFYPFSKNYYNLGLTDIFESPIGANWHEVLHWAIIETACFLPLFIIILTIKMIKIRL